MNILLIHQYFLEDDDGGGSRFNTMTRIWQDAGHNVEVIAGMMHANATEKRNEYNKMSRIYLFCYFPKVCNQNYHIFSI